MFFCTLKFQYFKEKVVQILTFTFYLKLYLIWKKYLMFFNIYSFLFLALVELMNVPDKKAFLVFTEMKRAMKDLMIAKRIVNYQKDESSKFLCNSVSAKTMKTGVNVYKYFSDKMILQKILHVVIPQGLKSDDLNLKKACRSYNNNSQNMSHDLAMTLLKHVEKALKHQDIKQIQSKYDILAKNVVIKEFFDELQDVLDDQETGEGFNKEENEDEDYEPTSEEEQISDDDDDEQDILGGYESSEIETEPSEFESKDDYDCEFIDCR